MYHNTLFKEEVHFLLKKQKQGSTLQRCEIGDSSNAYIHVGTVILVPGCNEMYFSNPI